MKKNILNFRILKEKLILIIWYIGTKLKDFFNYQNPINLFINLRDGNINPREVIKDQINFKSDLSKIKKGNVKSKSNKILK